MLGALVCFIRIRYICILEIFTIEFFCSREFHFCTLWVEPELFIIINFSESLFCALLQGEFDCS